MTEEERQKALQARRVYEQGYREKNRERINTYSRQWAAANRDKKRAIDKKYRENNPEAVKAARHRYWLKKAGQLPPGETPQQPQEQPQGVNTKCMYCGATFTPKRSDAKFCGTSCRVMNNRKQKRQ